ncbi:low-density lipoprotein receptor-related protein 8-like [Corticium candelabrum]|uniref:low-density lipoprotein receptor-related protein 8-like n=1 Tax=Corticium candelabrum TaxID=121492 RepID=UPI002E26AEE3|nr:low-density lipoprotein receptor-related protein 8-like [Corticium candelabrum]
MRCAATLVTLILLRMSTTSDSVCQPKLFYKCGNECVSRSWICDGYEDCGDGSDETFCGECKEWFRCKSGHPCIEKKWVCDGTHDCDDGSDESVSLCGACASGEFHCTTSDECIGQSSVCDGNFDCFDYSDEQPPHCYRPTKSPCNLTNEFNCRASGSFHRCIPKYWTCDGERDCDSGIDEGDFCNPPGLAASVSPTSARARLSPSTPQPVIVQCADDEFQCYDGFKCLQWSHRCDSIVDCHDNSDESGCADVPHCPPKLQFSCANSNCVPLDKHCNEVDDCGDNSDEFNCGLTQPKWQECEGMFRCGNGHCLTVKRLCDNKTHCNDGSDEKNCFTNECLNSNPCPGDQKCIDEPTSYRCTCARGYRKTNDGCEEVDECQTYGHCAQFCVNTPGSFVCSCSNGYTLKADGHTCKANDGNAKLLYADGQDVKLMDLNTKSIEGLAKHRLSVIPVAFHFRTGMIYFGEYQWNRICAVPADNSAEPKPILTTVDGTHSPDGLAVDYLNDWIYWSSPAYRTIFMAKLDGSYRRVVVNESMKLDEPRGLAVDPLRGYLFWADWGNHSHIGAAAMDGTGQRHIVVDGLVWPNGIAVDTITQRIYWVDGNRGVVEVCDYLGHNRRVIIQGGIGRPLFIALYEEKVYVSSDWGPRNMGRVFVANRFDGSHLMMIDHDVDSVQGIAVYQKQQQQHTSNHCDRANCSHYCVTSFVSDYKCFCPDGSHLLNDERTCSVGVERCNDSYCNYNGHCVKEGNTNKCLCRSDRTGSRCTDVVRETVSCPITRCHSRGRCYSLVDQYCICNDGYSGVYCESDISPITSPFENSTTTSPAPPRVVGNVGQNKGSNAVGISVGGAIGGLVVVAIIIILVILLVKNVRGKLSINFDNPMYHSDSSSVVIPPKSGVEEVNHSKEVNGMHTAPATSTSA